MAARSVFIRIPSYDLGNVGDAALISTLTQYLNNMSLQARYYCPTKNIKRNSMKLARQYSALIYFGNDCLAYYDIDTKLVRAFLDAKKTVLFINTSYGPQGTTKNDIVLKQFLANPKCSLIARDRFSYQLIKDRLAPVNNLLLSADLAFTIPLPNISSSNNNTTDDIDSEHNSNNILDVSDMLDMVDIFADTPINEWQRKDRQEIQSLGGNTIIINLHDDFGSLENNECVLNAVIGALSNPDMWLAKELKAGRLYIIFLSHDSRKPETHVMAKATVNIRTKLSPNLHKNIIVSPSLTVQQELILLQSGINVNAILTGRMHLSILGMRCGIPAAAISYNGVKAQGTFELFGEPIASNILTVNSNNIRASTTNPKITNLTSRAIDNLMHDMLIRRRTEYLDCIQTQLPAIQNMANLQIQTIKDIIMQK